ncbi:dentin sialophosphoprotein [Stomoxys calcitrans]|uniref:dentin sialophosphoprotein n=1 Tax=Stomoxys calcitrans TaxID=35570 RepID=UPI0027E32DDD|nr:dentin sialophosphoprotein [Stomoxys calcitrans]
MSHWITLIGLMQQMCSDSTEIEELLKETERLHKEKQLLQNYLKESERENMDLQMDLFKAKSVMAPSNEYQNERSNIETNSQLIKSCINLQSAVSQIDFTKILQCNYLEMEQNMQKEMQQMQDDTVSLSKWYEQMEQRDVVKRYREAEKEYKESNEDLSKIKSSFEKTKQEAFIRINNAREKRNKLIVCLAERSKQLNSLRLKFTKLQEYEEKLEDLKKRKAEMMHKLEAAKSKSNVQLKPYTTFSNSCPPSMPSSLLQPFIGDMPKFPTFEEIYKSLDQDISTSQVASEITVIENTTNIMIKSILRNTQENSMEINQSITTTHTKHVQFKKQLKEEFELNISSDATISDSSSVDSQDSIKAEPKLNQIGVMPTEASKLATQSDVTLCESSSTDSQDTVISNLKIDESEETEVKERTLILDSLPSSNDTDLENMVYDEEETNPTATKPKLEILECVVIKSPVAKVDCKNKENIFPHEGSSIKAGTKTKVLEKSDIEKMPPPPPITTTKKPCDNFEKTFYEEFLNFLPTSTDSADTDSDSPSTSRNVLKDIDSYLNEGEPESNNEIATSEECSLNSLDFNSKEQNESSNSKDSENALDFLDFGTTNSFTFDSNDDNEASGGICDFLF